MHVGAKSSDPDKDKKPLVVCPVTVTFTCGMYTRYGEVSSNSL